MTSGGITGGAMTEGVRDIFLQRTAAEKIKDEGRLRTIAREVHNEYVASHQLGTWAAQAVWELLDHEIAIEYPV